MTDVTVPFGDKPSDTAVLLLDAAEKLDLDASVVRTSGDGTFVVPEDVAKKSGVDFESDEDDKTPAKKTAAKKTAASDKE